MPADESMFLNTSAEIAGRQCSWRNTHLLKWTYCPRHYLNAIPFPTLRFHLKLLLYIKSNQTIDMVDSRQEHILQQTEMAQNIVIFTGAAGAAGAAGTAGTAGAAAAGAAGAAGAAAAGATGATAGWSNPKGMYWIRGESEKRSRVQ